MISMLDVRALNVHYGQAQALWDVSLTIGAAEIVCVVGPNGAGKTTLANTIAGLHRASSGTINVDDADLTALPNHAVCDHGVAIVPEGRHIFAEMSVRDNLLLGAYRRGARAEYRESEARVYELFPRLAERPRQLAACMSGGEQQMLAIGRALMSKPSMLILDEPSLGLAPVIVDEVFDAVQAINADGVTVLMVEQDVHRALELAHRGYLLIEGRVVVSGTSAELRESTEVQQRVLGG
jgi:branched-chain amino acid transport system ATP-binding protein